MSRGLLVFVLQTFVCLAVALLGAWTLFRPKSFQAFVHENFGIFPSVKPGIQSITILIRLSSAFFCGTPICWRRPSVPKFSFSFILFNTWLVDPDIEKSTAHRKVP